MKITSWLLFGLAIICVVGIWLYWPSVFAKFVEISFDPPASSATHVSPERLGPAGDAYGALNTIFTGLAFVGLICTLWLQWSQHNKDQEQQRVQQRIDQFFRMVEEWRQAVRETSFIGEQDHDDENRRLHGPHAFCRMENELLGEINKRSGWYHEPYARGRFLGAERQEAPLDEFPRVDIARAGALFESFYEERAGALLGQIFRLQEGIVRFAHRELPEHANKLIDTFRSMISDPELHLLLFYALSELADREFVELIRTYGLLDGLARKNRRFICHRIPEITHFVDASKFTRRLVQLPAPVLRECVPAGHADAAGGIGGLA